MPQTFHHSHLGEAMHALLGLFVSLGGGVGTAYLALSILAQTGLGGCQWQDLHCHRSSQLQVYRVAHSLGG